MTELLNIFLGISCAYIDKNGRVKYECYGVADKESNRQPFDIIMSKL